MECARIPFGEYKLHHVDEATGVWTPTSEWLANDVLYAWGQVAASRLFAADSPLLINALYIEYENVSSPGTPVSVPTFARSDGSAYYASLASSQTRDYLRVPLLLTPSVDVAPGFEAYFAAGGGNRVTVFGQTSGSVGVNGRPFSDSANSTMCGIALVAAPVLADRTQDVIFARKYYPTGNQTVKQPSSQLGVTYRVTFG